MGLKGHPLLTPLTLSSRDGEENELIAFSAAPSSFRQRKHSLRLSRALTPQLFRVGGVQLCPRRLQGDSALEIGLKHRNWWGQRQLMGYKDLIRQPRAQVCG